MNTTQAGKEPQKYLCTCLCTLILIPLRMSYKINVDLYLFTSQKSGFQNVQKTPHTDIQVKLGNL